MQIFLNGQATQVTGCTLHAVVVEQGLQPETLIAEVNLVLIQRDQWPQHVLQEGDRIELLNFVGGG
jgi:sulfur carrier protein